MRKVMVIPIILLSIIGIIALIQGNSQARDHAYIRTEPMVFIPPTTTTTTVPPTTTTVKKSPSTTQQRVSRGNTQPRVSASPSGGDRWQRLAQCESASNSWSGTYKGYFQFSQGYANQYGMSPSMSYEDQKAIAQKHAATHNPYSEWPNCWRKTQ